MANKRTAELEIKLQGAQTLEQLNDTLEEINNEIKDVDKNSESFKELASLARKADAEVSELDESLKGVTSDEKADGFLKMGEGIAGAFAAVQGLTTAFGGTSEELDKVIAKVGGMILALDGIKKVTEALNSTQRKIFRETIAGWKKSAIAAKLFGTTTKKALTATGIGIFIVLLGTLIANWDDVTEAVGGFVESIPLIGDMVKWITKLSESVGGLGEVFSAVGAGILGFFKTGTSAVEGFDKAIAEAQFQKTIADSEKAIESATKNFETSQAQLQVIINKTAQTYDDEIAKIKAKIILEEDENELASLRLQLREQEATKQLKTIEFINQATDAEQKLIAAKKEGIRLLTIDEERNNANLKFKEQILRLEKKREKELTDIIIKRNVEAKFRAEAGKNLAFKTFYITEKQVQAEIKLLKAKKDSNLTTKDTLEILKNAPNIFKKVIKDDTDFIERIALYWDETADNIEETNKKYDERIEKLKSELTTNESIKELNEKLSDIEFKRAQIVLEIGNIENNGIINKNKSLELEAQLELIDRQRKALLLGSAEIIEEVLDMKQEEIKIDVDREKVIGNLVKNWDDIRKQQISVLSLQGKILGLSGDMADETVDIYQGELSFSQSITVANKELERQNELSKEGLTTLQLFDLNMQILSEKIALFGQLTIDALQAPITFLDGRVEKLNQELDILTDKELDNAARLAEINGLLADAQGDRHQQLLADKEEEMKINGDIANQQLDIEKKIIKASEARAKFQKAQNITSALINTSLAVVQALPNIPLSILVGVIGAANVAAIASQPLPAIPQFVVGGYTEHGNKNDVAGVVHKSEYIIPKDVLETDMGSQLAAMLESMRIGFASGGFTSNAPDSSTSLPSLTNVIGQEQQFVSVVEIESVGRNVKVLESRSSL